MDSPGQEPSPCSFAQIPTYYTSLQKKPTRRGSGGGVEGVPKKKENYTVTDPHSLILLLDLTLCGSCFCLVNGQSNLAENEFWWLGGGGGVGSG